MEARVYNLDTVLGDKYQWVVPVYQRHYEWETKEDKQIPKLWDDLKDKAIEKLDKQSPHPHYFGAIICYEPPKQGFGVVRQRLLIDGQQRITSFQLTLAAIREAAREYESQKLNVINAYLYNEKSPGMAEPDRERFKLWPSSLDRDLYKSIVEEEPLDELRSLQTKCFYNNGNLIWGKAPKLLCAFWYLYEEMKGFIQERTEEGEPVEQVIDALLDSFLYGFRIVVIELDQDDNAQEIFASLNGLGEPLSPFDLIRNDIFLRAEKAGENADKLFDEQWKSFEEDFWNEQIRQGRLKRARANYFIAHVVVAEMAQEINVGKVSTEYQHYVRDQEFETVTEELDILLKHADTYRAMEEQDQDALFAGITDVFRVWDMSTFHPLVLWINAQSIKDEDKAKLFKLLESYIVRREICGFTTKSYNKVVPGIIRYIREEPEPASAFSRCLSDHLTGEASKMPTDPEVVEQFTRREVYGNRNIPTPRLRYIFQRIEHAMRSKFDEQVSVFAEDLTIEHVMPQRWAEHWPLANDKTAPCESVWSAIYDGHTLDEETKTFMETREEAVNTFGNLTLLTGSLNPSIGNKGWEIKREYLGESLLAMNREIANKEQWNEESIKERSAALAKVANKIWKSSVD